MRSMTENCYRILNIRAGALQSPFLLAVRLYWGWQFTQTGWGKVNNIARITEFFTTLGIPLPGLTAHFIAGLELAGGCLLVLGLAARLVAPPLTVSMLVAYVTADREALFSVISDPDKFYAAAPYTFLVASLIILIFGPGKFSLDAWIVGKQLRSAIPNPTKNTGTGTRVSPSRTPVDQYFHQSIPVEVRKAFLHTPRHKPRGSGGRININPRGSSPP